MKGWALMFLATLLSVSLYGGLGFAQSVTMEGIRIVAESWIRLIIHEKGAWGTSETGEIEEIREFTRKGRPPITQGPGNDSRKGMSSLKSRRDLVPVQMTPQ